MVNHPTAGVHDHVPFGGRKASSYGPREQGRYAVDVHLRQSGVRGAMTAGSQKVLAKAPPARQDDAGP